MEAWLGWSDSLLPFKTTIVWSVASRESHENCCHQMSDFNAKMHQIRFGLELRPRPCWGSLQRTPRPPSWISGALLFREVKEGEEKRREGEGKKREGNVCPPPHCEILNTPLVLQILLHNKYDSFAVETAHHYTYCPAFRTIHMCAGERGAEGWGSDRGGAGCICRLANSHATTEQTREIRQHPKRLNNWRRGDIRRPTRELRLRLSGLCGAGEFSSSRRKKNLVNPVTPKRKTRFFSVIYSLRSATWRLLVVLRFRLRTLGPRAFSVAGPSLWNPLPGSLRDLDLGRDDFRRLLTTHVFTLYWII